MASYLLHFTNGLGPVFGQMPQLASGLVRQGLYGISSTATVRNRIRPGEVVVASVGSAHRAFVADAMVESSYHRLDAEETARRPAWMNLDHGIGLRDVHTWPEPVPLMSVWPQTAAGVSTSKTALFYGTPIVLGRRGPRPQSPESWVRRGAGTRFRAVGLRVYGASGLGRGSGLLASLAFVGRCVGVSTCARA